jgi:hypothetical protein
MLTQLRESYEELTKTGFQVIVITPSTGSYLEKFVEAFGPYPFTIYGDPKRALYRSMGHQSMEKWKLFLKAGTALLKGGTSTFFPKDEAQKKLVQQAMKTHDVFIQGGTWLFDQNGNQIWHHIDSTPEDHASIKTILSKINKYNEK